MIDGNTHTHTYTDKQTKTDQHRHTHIQTDRQTDIHTFRVHTHIAYIHKISGYKQKINANITSHTHTHTPLSSRPINTGDCIYINTTQPSLISLPQLLLLLLFSFVVYMLKLTTSKPFHLND